MNIMDPNSNGKIEVMQAGEALLTSALTHGLLIPTHSLNPTNPTNPKELGKEAEATAEALVLAVCQRHAPKSKEVLGILLDYADEIEAKIKEEERKGATTGPRTESKSPEANPNPVQTAKDKALNVAASLGNAEATELLIARGAEPIYPDNEPLWKAEASGSRETIRAVLKAHSYKSIKSMAEDNKIGPEYPLLWEESKAELADRNTRLAKKMRSKSEPLTL